MGFFDKLFKRNREEKKEVNNNYINIQRNDGSILYIKPKLDKEGNQVSKIIKDQYERIIADIPEYFVYEEGKNGEFVSHTILMEIDKELLDNPYYSDYIANGMLSQDSLHGKVLNDYHGYAGLLNFDENGMIKGRAIRPEVVEALNVEKIDEHNAKIQKDDERLEKLREEISGKTCHVKENHAERLSPEMMPDWMKEGYSRSGRNDRNSGMDR